MKRSLLALVLTIVATISLTFFFSLSGTWRDSKDFSLEGNVFVACEKIEDKTLRYSCYKDKALDALQNGRTIPELNQFALEFPYKRAHFVEHAIGRATLIAANYNIQLAMEKCEGDCTIGYFHGVGQEWAKYAPSDRNKYLDALEKFCPGLPPKCFHHVGHFYMSQNENFVESLKLCNELEDDNRFSGCISGVVHQQAIEFGHRDFLDTCPDYTERLRAGCYTYGSFYHARWSDAKSPEQLIGRCNELHGKIPDSLNFCYVGLSQVFAEKGIATQSLCENLNDSSRRLCIKSFNSPPELTSGLNLPITHIPQ